jgi:hypothetical protein
MTVQFCIGQSIDICTSDAKFLAMCVSKQEDDAPAIDVLPRIRYRIPVVDAPPCTGRVYDRALFPHGLHAALVDEEHVCVVNFGDRVVRLKSGTRVLSD